MAIQDLYFFSNPYTGLVKIGVAVNPDDRRRNLEFACGVALETIAVFRGQGGYESALHEAFTAERQIGEWFVPTGDVMAVATGAEAFDSLLTRYADRIAGYRRAAEERRAARSAELQTERDREVARLAAVRAEEARIKREEAAKRAEAKRKRQEREAARLAADRARTEAGRRPNDRFKLLAEERATVVRTSQRARDCATIGVRVAVS